MHLISSVVNVSESLMVVWIDNRLLWNKVMLPIAYWLNYYRIKLIVIGWVSLTSVIQFLAEIGHMMPFLWEDSTHTYAWCIACYLKPWISLEGTWQEPQSFVVLSLQKHSWLSLIMWTHFSSSNQFLGHNSAEPLDKPMVKCGKPVKTYSITNIFGLRPCFGSSDFLKICRDFINRDYRY